MEGGRKEKRNKNEMKGKGERERNYPADFLSQLLFLHFSSGSGLEARSNRGSEGTRGRGGGRTGVGVVVDFTSLELLDLLGFFFLEKGRRGM